MQKRTYFMPNNIVVIKENNMGRACRTPGDMRDLYNISGGKLVEK
jgi:hypothetical protein